jgi:hypothetical protein
MPSRRSGETGSAFPVLGKGTGEIIIGGESGLTLHDDDRIGRSAGSPSRVDGDWGSRVWRVVHVGGLRNTGAG